jgi:hypothetical protein
MQDITVARLQRTRVNRVPSPPSIKCNVRWYCVRVSLRTVKYSLRNTKEKGVVGNLCISLDCPRREPCFGSGSSTLGADPKPVPPHLKIRSGMFIPGPGSWIWMFSHPGSRYLKRGKKKQRIPDPQHVKISFGFAFAVCSKELGDIKR